MSKAVIHLLGDAILDNYAQLRIPENDLRKELSELGFTVNNCAVDEVKVSDILNGIIPKDVYIRGRTYVYPQDKDGKMFPLNSVLSTIGVNKSFVSVYGGIHAPRGADNMVVISMGGNDIRPHVNKIILGAQYFIGSVVTEKFILDFDKVIEMVKTGCTKIVLVSIYLPYLGVGSSYGLYSPVAKPIINKWNKFIYDMGKKYNIPVLDLSRTLNVGNREHYGKDDTRVSNISNKCMADAINYIYKNYDNYHIYYCPDCQISNISIE